jgi:RNA polymerase sigma-70 factor (ECF subfamily)
MADIYPSGEYRQFESEGIRNRREAIWRRIFERAAGALQAEVKDAIPRSPTRPPRKLWQRATIRPDSARQGRLIEICLTRGCSLEDAKELVQEAHLRLFMYQRSAHVRKPESLLRRILINLSINHYHRVLSSGFVFENIDKLDRDGILIDPTPDSEQTLAAEEQLDAVVNLVSAMSQRTCQIFIAQRSGYSYEEVGVAFAIKPRTVEKHVAIATSALMEMMPAHFPRASDCRS